MEELEYMKIKALFKRDPKGNVMLGEFSDPAFDYLKDCRWIATEKIDGTNTRIIWDGHRITWKGHTDSANIPDFEEKYMQAMFGSPETEEVFEQVFGEKQAIVFGEFYGHKVQKAGELMNPKENGFIVFDINIGGYWLDFGNVKDVAGRLGLLVVPEAMEGTLTELKDRIAKDGTSLHETVSGNSAPLEGYVCFPSVPLYFRNGTPIKVKIKVRDLINGGYKL